MWYCMLCYQYHQSLLWYHHYSHLNSNLNYGKYSPLEFGKAMSTSSGIGSYKYEYHNFRETHVHHIPKLDASHGAAWPMNEVKWHPTGWCRRKIVWSCRKTFRDNKKSDVPVSFWSFWGPPINPNIRSLDMYNVQMYIFHCMLLKGPLKTSPWDITIYTLWETNIAMDNHHFNRSIIRKWSICHSSVRFPDGKTPSK